MRITSRGHRAVISLRNPIAAVVMTAFWFSSVALAVDAPPNPNIPIEELGGTGIQTDPVSRANELLASGQPREAEALLVRYLVYRPDDGRAKQLLLASRIAILESQIREALEEQSK